MNIEELKRERARWEEQCLQWNKNFNRVADTFACAKEMEKTDPFGAIKLYLSIKETKYSNFDILGRLIILYRKTDQVEQEIKHIDLKIDCLYKSARFRMFILKSKCPRDADLIDKCYNEEISYTTPNGRVVDFFIGIRKLISRRERLEKKLLKQVY
ncbi:hypothetical protein ACIRNY_10855 [Capnocytophaga canimorsus]|uniref:hypothetical protein n=1 Tax=Capnocytophaga canimorsus TaxID=28188 RepID=UPI00384B81D1